MSIAIVCCYSIASIIGRSIAALILKNHRRMHSMKFNNLGNPMSGNDEADSGPRTPTFRTSKLQLISILPYSSPVPVTMAPRRMHATGRVHLHTAGR